MKKSVEVIGLPIISISEGIELGTAKHLVINPAGGEVAAIAVDDGVWYHGAKFLPFSAITGIGESAVTVDSAASIIPIANAPELEKLLLADIKIIGAKVLTNTGRIQGKVAEIVIDNTGKIASCEIEGAGEASVPAQRILTFGKDVLIISEDAAAGAKPVAAQAAAAPAPQQHQPQAAAAAAQPAEQNNEDAAKKFDDKQRKYLLGKKATRRIETDNGVVIVEQGGEITEEVIQKAKLAGKFVELSMSI